MYLAAYAIANFSKSQSFGSCADGGDLTINRRSCRRFNVSLPMLLFTAESTMPIVAETRDIGMDGFFCLVADALPVGKRIRCLILLNDIADSDPSFGMCIEAEAHVARVAIRGTGNASIGLGCTMARFHIVPAAAWFQNVPHPIGHGSRITPGVRSFEQ